jgi:hypothetical protein
MPLKGLVRSPGGTYHLAACLLRTIWPPVWYLPSGCLFGTYHLAACLVRTLWLPVWYVPSGRLFGTHHLAACLLRTIWPPVWYVPSRHLFGMYHLVACMVRTTSLRKWACIFPTGFTSTGFTSTFPWVLRRFAKPRGTYQTACCITLCRCVSRLFGTYQLAACLVRTIWLPVWYVPSRRLFGPQGPQGQNSQGQDPSIPKDRTPGPLRTGSPTDRTQGPTRTARVPGP